MTDRPPLAAPAVPEAVAEAARLQTAYARRRDAERYAWSSPGYCFMMQELERRLLAALRRHGAFPLAERRILDLGCGNGQWLRTLVQWGARPEHVTGIDMLPDRVAAARRLCAPGTRVTCGDAAATGLPDASFDLVLQFTVFTSILAPALRRQVAAEMRRVLRPDGLIVWYDFRVDNPRNPDVRRVGRTEIRRLFPGCRIELRSLTLVPPLARALAGRSWLLCHLLAAIPWLRTHYLGVIRPPLHAP